MYIECNECPYVGICLGHCNNIVHAGWYVALSMVHAQICIEHDVHDSVNVCMDTMMIRLGTMHPG